jgi:ATP-dependent RNA helicase DeaD
MSQHRREISMSQFRRGQADILVATDVAARGIDVPEVALVVNYDVPNQEMVYFHRIGRTARAGAKGRAITLVSYSSVGDFNLIKQQVKAPMTDLNEKMGITVDIPDPLKRQVGPRRTFGRGSFGGGRSFGRGGFSRGGFGRSGGFGGRRDYDRRDSNRGERRQSEYRRDGDRRDDYRRDNDRKQSDTRGSFGRRQYDRRYSGRDERREEKRDFRTESGYGRQHAPKRSAHRRRW